MKLSFSSCITLLGLSFLMACQKPVPLDEQFGQLADDYLKGYYATNPLTAVSLGLHEFDGQFVIRDRITIAHELAQLQHYDSAFAQLDTTRFSNAELMVDYKILTAAIKKQRYNIEDIHLYEKPFTYVNGIDVSWFVKRNYDAPEKRLAALVKVLHQAPAYYQAARANIGRNLAPEDIEVALRGLEGNAGFVERDVMKAFESFKNDSLQAILKAATLEGAAAMRDFAKYLKTNVQPQAKGSYAIGLANYKKLLLYNEWLTTNPEEILATGMSQIQKERAEFAAAAKIIDPTKTPAEVFKTLQVEHPAAQDLVEATRKNCEAIRQFLLDKQIIGVPSEVRATVKKTPEYMVGATAAMDPPGPFEKASGTEAYYYVTPPMDKWSAKQKEEWMTQFNRYVIDVVSIHEAYPGHYVQFLRLNASKASDIRKVFSSYAFVEGWAHYTEQMMLEEGFGRTDSITAAKYKMAQLSESLMRYCRLVSSIQEHLHGWSVAQATQFFMDNCYYEKQPAREEALRGTFDPGYLSYSLGKLQILALRDEVKKKKGSAFKLKDFHDALLDHGMPPITLLKPILLQ